MGHLGHRDACVQNIPMHVYQIHFMDQALYIKLECPGQDRLRFGHYSGSAYRSLI